MRPEADPATTALRERLRHVYWIGGGSGGGKSTMARRMATRHGLELYATDDVMGAHTARAAPGTTPSLAEFLAMDMDERWVNRSPETMLETFHWYRGEGFELIVEDLLGLPARPGVIAEGFRLLPHLVAPLLSVPNQAVWLLPTPRFRRSALEERGSLWTIPRKTSNPDRALRNLHERDHRFTERTRRQAEHLGLRVIDVDGTLPEDDLEQVIGESFGL